MIQIISELTLSKKVRLMTQNNQPLRWQINPDRSYIAISYEGREVGFCDPEFAVQVIEALNKNEQLVEENEILNRALQMACWDLIRQASGNINQVNDLREKYLETARRPEHGTEAIAFLLRKRQEELDISDQEFVGFCNSYKLSPKELLNIYDGKEVNDNQLKVLARILGKTIQELTDVRDGLNTNELEMLARLLGASPDSLTSELTDGRDGSKTQKYKKK